jgi:hypothetical protein
MAYGIKVALPGYDATTATVEQLAITSEKSMLKQERSGTVSYTFSGSPSDVTILTVNHNLGYIPACFASWNRIAIDKGAMLPFYFLTVDFNTERIYWEVTTTQFFIYYKSTDPSPSNRTGETYVFDYTINYDDAA